MSETTVPPPLRIYITGSCEGLTEIVDALGIHGGSSSSDDRGSAGGGFGPDRRAPRRRPPRDPRLGVPADASRRSASTRGRPIDPRRLGRGSALLEEALDADVADVLLLPQLTENVVFAIRKAAMPGGAAGGAARAHGRVDHRVLAEGRDRQDGRSRRTSPPCSRSTRARTHAAPRPRPAVRRRGDHARASSRRRRSTTSSSRRASSTRRSSPATRRAHPSGLDVLPAPLRPEDAELVTEAKLARLLEVARDVVRRDRRRHVAVLPRADARDARPHGRAAARSAGSTCRR